MGRLSHELEPRPNRTTARLVWRLEIGPGNASIQVGEQELGLAPIVAAHPQGYIAAAEAIDRPVRGQHRFDPGLDQRLVPGARRAHIAEIAHDLPAIESRIVDDNGRLPRTGPAIPAGKPEAIEKTHR